MSLVINVPSKTFFAGEYSALNGGPVITVATAPRFELRVRSGSGWTTGIHKDSPAGKLIKRYALFFNQFDLEFVDPHMGRGGWGASTAQFLACYSLLQWQDANEVGEQNKKDIDINKMLLTYKDLAWDGKGLPPSGADLVGQLKGGFTFFEKRRGVVTPLEWPFPDLEFYLVATGDKVATHEHLQSLKSINTDKIEASVRLVQEGLVQASKELMVEGILRLSKELEDRHWVTPKTREVLAHFNSIPGVLASKGCGALGADVALAIVEKKKSILFEALLKDDQTHYFSRHHLSGGLTVYVESEMKIESYSEEMRP